MGESRVEEELAAGVADKVRGYGGQQSFALSPGKRGQIFEKKDLSYCFLRLVCGGRAS